MTSTTALMELAEQIAIEAGQFIRDRRPADLTVAATKSSLVDPVTAMDTAAEQLIRERIAQARPDDAILGEEGGASAGSSGLTWILDPIDGTVNYLYGLPNYAVSVGVVRGSDAASWTPLAGCVYAPVLGHTWSAGAGLGARRDGMAITVNHVTDPSMALVSTGFGYQKNRRAGQGRVVANLLPQVRDIRRAGAASVDMCWVADGTVDAMYERGLNPWDMAAGWVIATEAGARCTGLHGHGPGADMTVLGCPELVDWLVRQLEELHADSDITLA